MNITFYSGTTFTRTTFVLRQLYYYIVISYNIILHDTMLYHIRHARKTTTRERKRPSITSKVACAHGSFLIRRQRGHPGLVLPLVIYNSVNH